MQTSGVTCREKVFPCLSAVIASEAKQSRVPNVALDCFASLAMTLWQQLWASRADRVVADDQLSAVAAPPL